jgi:hypothetical protein
MPERSLEDESRELAEKIAAGPDDVAEFAAIHAETYRQRRAVVLGMLHVDAMVGLPSLVRHRGSSSRIPAELPCQ